MEELDPRKQTLLRAIVFEYVSGAEPVASEQIVAKYDLGVKSATVRSEMAEMSELGYLEQPHTSAGRIPSDRGYRYYVDRLIIQREPESSAKRQVAGATEDGQALQELLRGTTRVLSRLTQQLSAATVVRDASLTIRNVVVSALGPQQALVVMVLGNGQVFNRMIECPPDLTLDDIGLVNERLGEAIAGRPLRAILRAKAPGALGTAADKLMSALWATIRSYAKERTKGALIMEGEEFIFGKPEFQRDVASLASLLDQLKEGDVLFEALAGPSDQAQTVRIGKENRSEQLHSFSIVRQSFFVGDHEAGTIAIIGPTRMAYERGIPLIGHTARALSESLTRFFG